MMGDPTWVFRGEALTGDIFIGEDLTGEDLMGEGERGAEAWDDGALL